MMLLTALWKRMCRCIGSLTTTRALARARVVPEYFKIRTLTKLGLMGWSLGLMGRRIF